MGDITITFEREEDALKAYASGLRHGLVTVQVRPPPPQGRAVTVILELTYRRKQFKIRGTVAHSGDVATVIQVDALPPKLLTLLGVKQPVEREAEEASNDGPYEEETIRTPMTMPTRPSGIRSSSDVDDRPSYLAERLKRVAKIRQSKPNTAAAQPPPTATTSTEQAARALMSLELPTGGPGIPVPFQENRNLPGVVVKQGSLKKTSPYEILLHAFVERFTGIIVLDSSRERYWGFILDGAAVHYLRQPPLQTESTDSLLVRRKLLSKAVLDRARWLADVTARPLISVVMRLGLIERKQLDALRAEQVRLVTRRLLALREGSFRFFEAPEIREVYETTKTRPLDPVWKRASFSFSRLTELQLNDRLSKVGDLYVTLTKLGNQVKDNLPMDEEQREFADHGIRPGWTITEMLERSAITRGKGFQLLLTLELLGIITLRADSGVDPKLVARERRVMDLFENLSADHYAYLDLHWSALPAELAAGCDRVEKELQRLIDAGTTIPESETMFKAIRKRLNEIRTLAGDRKERRTYLASVADQDERFMAAELYIKQGEMALFRHETSKARDCFSRLQEIDPGGASSAERRDRARAALLQLEDGSLPAMNDLEESIEESFEESIEWSVDGLKHGEDD